MRSFRADDAGPNDPGGDISKLSEDVLARLEDAGVPEEVCDKIIELIETWEWSQIRRCEHGVIDSDLCVSCYGINADLGTGLDDGD